MIEIRQKLDDFEYCCLADMDSDTSVARDGSVITDFGHMGMGVRKLEWDDEERRYYLWRGGERLAPAKVFFDDKKCRQRLSHHEAIVARLRTTLDQMKGQSSGSENSASVPA